MSGTLPDAESVAKNSYLLTVGCVIAWVVAVVVYVLR